jgi:hypothetical protein
MLNGVMDKALIIGQGTNERIVIEEVLLLGFVATDQLPHGAQTVAAVRVGDGTGAVDLLAPVVTNQTE